LPARSPIVKVLPWLSVMDNCVHAVWAIPTDLVIDWLDVDDVVATGPAAGDESAAAQALTVDMRTAAAAIATDRRVKRFKMNLSDGLQRLEASSFPGDPGQAVPISVGGRPVGAVRTASMRPRVTDAADDAQAGHHRCGILESTGTCAGGHLTNRLPPRGRLVH